MSEITFTELRQFNSGSSKLFAITKYNGLIFFATNKTGGGEVWTYNPITGRFLLNSTFPSGDGVRDFLVTTDPGNSSIDSNSLFAVTGGTDGKLYQYDNDGTWTELADSGDSIIYAIKLYEGNFYYGTNGDEVLKWDGGVQTISLTAAETTNDPIFALFVHDSLLFAGTQQAAAPKIFVFDNSSWSLEDTLSDTGVNDILCFEEFNSELYAGTSKAGAGNNLWKRDENVSPVNWIPIESLSGTTRIETLEVFFDKLYMGTFDIGTTDASIRRYDGANFATVKDPEAGTNGFENNGSYADGEDCLYLGTTVGADTVRLLAICPRCSDELLISIASPFGWNIRNCDITPEICKVEDGCFCQILDTEDTTTIQITWNGAETPHLAISDITTGVESSITAFTNIIGNIWEVDIDVSGLNLETVQLIITTRTGTDEGEWVDKSIGGIALTTTFVSSLTRIYIAGNDPGTPVLKSSSDQGDSYTDKSQPATGSNGINHLTLKGSNEDSVMGVQVSGFGWSTDNLVSYDEDTDHGAGGPVIFDALNIVHVLVLNPGGGARLSADGGATWGALANSPPILGGNYQACFITSSLIYFVVGNNGKIFSTTDGGGTAWVEDHDSVNQLKGIHMDSTTVGWAVGTSGEILKTTDGSTWVAQASGVATQLNDVFFLNASTGWVVGASATILKTIDGGTTWTQQTAPGNDNLNAIHAFQSGAEIFAVAVGDSGAVYTLNDTTSVTARDVATSECIRIKNDFDCGLLIKYTNDDNFADFDYTNGLVNQIRIKAHFWQISSPTEKAIHITSAEEIIPTRQVVKKQIVLETDIMPEYMHEKLAVVFTHAAIEIDGITYVAEESYEYDFGNKYRQTKGKVTLTDKTYTKENIF